MRGALRTNQSEKDAPQGQHQLRFPEPEVNRPVTAWRAAADDHRSADCEQRSCRG